MNAKAIFAVISQVSILLPVVAGWVYYKKLTRSFRLLFYFFLSCIGFEILAAGMRIYWNNNMPGLHLFSITQFWAFSAVYYAYFKTNEVVRRLILANAIAATILAVLDALFIDGITHSNTASRSYDAASIVLYTLIYFYQLFGHQVLQSRRYQPVFWVSIAALLYFGNNLLYFMIRRYLLSSAREIETISYYYYMSLNIIAHALYAYSFRCFGTWKRES